MIFLGAGASKVFGIKTLQDMTQDLAEKMRNEGRGETIDDILAALRQFGLTPDFENVYKIVEGLVNPQEESEKVGP